MDKRIHYGWLICLSCTLLMVCTMGFCNGVFPVYLPFLERQGMSGAQTSALLAIRCLFGIAGMLLAEPFYRKLSMRMGLTVTCGITAGAFFLYGVSRTAWMFDAAAAASGIGYGLGTMIPVGILMKRWFSKRRGVAVGICAAGSGISITLFSPLITWIIESWGVSVAFRFQAIFVTAVGLLLVALVRDFPASIGLEPYGGSDCENSQEQTRSEGGRRPGAEWALVSCFLIGAVATSAPGHFSAHFAAQGYEMSLVSLAVSTFGLSLTFGKLVCGELIDVLGGRNGPLALFAAALAGCILCCMADGFHGWILFAALILMGVGMAPATVGIPLWAGDFAGGAEYPRVLKWLQIAYAAGGMILTMVPGLIFDHTGSYQLAYALMVLLLAAAMGLLCGAYEIQKKHRVY